MSILGILWSVHKAGGSCPSVRPRNFGTRREVQPQLRQSTEIYAAVIASHQRSLHPAKTTAKPSTKTTILSLSDTDHPGSPLSHRCTSTCRWGCNYPEQRHIATRRIQSKSPPCLASEVFVVAICSTCS